MTLTDDAVAHAEPVMGTVVSLVVFPGRRPICDPGEAINSACARLHEIDRIFSTWNPESPMSRLRTGSCSLDEVPAEIPQVLDLCREMKLLSGGLFDPWAMPGGVDPTGLVKGWAIDMALETLRAGGAAAAIVNGGGDVAMFGRPPDGRSFRIGIRHPWRPGSLACVLEIESAVATSGRYERGPHLIDPRDQSRPSHVASATVTGPCLAVADALATALAVGGDEVFDRVDALEGYDAYLVGSDGSERATSGIVFS